MDTDLVKTLRWFSKNIDFLLEDYHLEKENSVDLYFDAFDVTDALLGMSYYYDGARFKLDKGFATEEHKPLRDRVLVLCLAFARRLGTIKMLVPHQSEFLYHLNKDFSIPDINVPPKQLIRQFAEGVIRMEGIRGAHTPEPLPRGETDVRKIFDYVRTYAGSSRTLFKIKQMISGVTWQARLVNLRDEHVLELDSREIDLGELVETENFQRLKASFDACRRHVIGSNSNFADAVALTLLHSLVRDYRDVPGSPLPRFFVSSKTLGDTPWFLKVVEHAKMLDDFSYEGPNGKKYSVFREADYFVFRSSVRFDTSARSTGRSLNIFNNPDDLRNLQVSIDRLLTEKPTTITPEEVDRSLAGEYTINELISGLNNFSFFQNVWEADPKENEEIFLQELRDTIERLESQEFKDLVDRAKAEFQTALSHWVEGYEFMESLWKQMEKATAIMRRVHVERDLDYFRDFGLLRFGFPESAHNKINDVLEKLMHTAEGSDHIPQYDVIAACFHAVAQADSHDINNLAAATSALWVAGKYAGIIDLLRRVYPLPHVSLSLIYAAALLEPDQDWRHGQKILQELTERYSEVKESKEKSDLAVGIAYLNFHLWIQRGNYPLWDPPSRLTRKLDPNDHRMIDDAIRLAKEAYEELGYEDERKKVYALNQYLYYLVMGGTDSDIETIDAVLELLMDYRDKEPSSWQYRFDDTIARYFHRMTASASTEKEWSKYLKMAIQYGGYACKDAPWDRAVCDYSGRLIHLEAKGFRQRTPSKK